MPKVNMYQSLHTTVIGPKGDPVEIQIRTWEMHRIAEEGIAAHWLYKEKKSGRTASTTRWCGCASSSRPSRTPTTRPEFLDSVRVDLFPDEVYVFTPKGDVKALPEGSTPIDFAYAVHTEVGEHTVWRQGERQAGAAAHTRCARATSSRSSPRRTSTRAATGSRSSSRRGPAPRSTSG